MFDSHVAFAIFNTVIKFLVLHMLRISLVLFLLLSLIELATEILYGIFASAIEKLVCFKLDHIRF